MPCTFYPLRGLFRSLRTRRLISAAVRGLDVHQVVIVPEPFEFGVLLSDLDRRGDDADSASSQQPRARTAALDDPLTERSEPEPEHGRATERLGARHLVERFGDRLADAAVLHHAGGRREERKADAGTD